MPLGHIAVGIGVALILKPRYEPLRDRQLTFTIALLSLLPDLDHACRWWVSSDVPTCHRGFTHSLTFAIMAGGMVGWWLRDGPWRSKAGLAALCAAVVASHPLLDLVTTAAILPDVLGVMLAWPWSTERITLEGSPLAGLYLQARSLSALSWNEFVMIVAQNSLRELPVFLPLVPVLWMLRRTILQGLGYSRSEAALEE